ncbi:MAG: DinB family protein [Candidatus Promineifilaceae bacterium]
MQADSQPTLEVIYENWRGFDEKLRGAVAPLSAEQLSLQPAVHMWPVEQLVQHIIATRAGWFSGTLQDEDAQMEAYMEWGRRESPSRSAAELVSGLEATWAFIASRLVRWTPADRAQIFPDEWQGEIYDVSRSWVIYHVLEHDLFHGGEISLILGMNGLPAIDL